MRLRYAGWERIWYETECRLFVDLADENYRSSLNYGKPCDKEGCTAVTVVIH